MLNFKAPEISDRAWVTECLSNAKSMNNEFTFGSVFVWQTGYETKICKYKDFFIARYGRQGNVAYCPPIGKGDFKEAVEKILEDAKSIGVTPKIYGVTQPYKELIEKHFPCVFTFVEKDKYNDYIYEVEKMASLSGKKYHSKRNHITNFKKTYPDWTFEPISRDNINECIEMHTNWIKEREDDSDYSFEFQAVLFAFENYEELGFVGGLIRANGNVIAYTMGEKQSENCFVTHFEKAPMDVRGAFPIINQEFTKNCLKDYKYVNREEDLGLEGLRKAKRSYYPEILLEKNVAVYGNDTSERI